MARLQDASVLFNDASECGTSFTSALETAVLAHVQASPSYVAAAGSANSGMLYTQQALCQTT